MLVLFNISLRPNNNILRKQNYYGLSFNYSKQRIEKIIKSYMKKKEFVRIGTAGWNATRLVSISRMSAELKYISEDELW